MGALTSRQNAGVEDVDLATNHAYRYPPKSGCYFGSHFIMGGERFDTPQPEAYLFGENSDLNFLGNRPTPFPYPAPQPHEPTKTIKSLVNIRKESLRFIRVQDESQSGVNKTEPAERNKDSVPSTTVAPNTKYNIEFTFDSDIRCAITVHYFCSEEITPSGAIYTPRDASMNSETYHYKRGANQQFSQVSHVFDPSLYLDEELNYSFEKEIMPVVIQCVAEEGEDPKQSHITIAIVEKGSDGSFSLKALKQKQFVDGLCYLLQEIYGIENKNAEYSKTSSDDEVEDNGSECVICMCDMRDTLILPCRHLCLCNCCADSLRYQANNCPICRAPFRALLQIKALRKATGTVQCTSDTSQIPKSEAVPQGYEPVSLIEALNGPPAHYPSSVPSSGLPLSGAPVAPTVTPMSTQTTVVPVVMQQDAVTSPSIPVPVDSTNCRNFTGSFSSIQVAATMEDFAAQTDSPMSPIDVLSGGGFGSRTPEICLSVLLPDSPEKGADTSRADHDAQTQLRLSRSTSFEKSGAATDSSTAAQEACQALNEAQSLRDVCSQGLLGKCDRSVSMSTPDSLHLCERQSIGSSTLVGSTDGQTDISPGGEESDYYTPEDPNMTILTEQRGAGSGNGSHGAVLGASNGGGSLPRGATSVVAGGGGGCDSGATRRYAPALSSRAHPSKAERGESSEVTTLSEDGEEDEEEVEGEERGALKGVLPTYIETISLPGTPLSHSSNRSSGDSFSSMSSTRLLLPNQSQETLAEDRML